MILEKVLAKKEKAAEELETIDEIIGHYQSHHHATGKSFKERIKKIEQWADPDNTHALQLKHEAEYVAAGKPGDDSMPGAYNVAYKVMDQHMKKPNDKLDDEDKIRDILESYVDQFLTNALGEKFTERMRQAKESGASDEQIREVKGQLFQRYHRNEDGDKVIVENVLSDSYIKKLKGKKRVEFVSRLKDLRDKTTEGYSNYLLQTATQGLVSEEDILESSKYIGGKLSDAGLKPDKSFHLKDIGEQVRDYSLLLQNTVSELIKKGYKKIEK
jgi:hypothetical protein